MKELSKTIANVTETYSLESLSVDILGKLAPLLKQGWFIKPEDGKMHQPIRAVTTDHLWAYVRPRKDIKCGLWGMIFFKILNIFPQQCKKCWKVVIKPRTVKELFQLYALMQHGTERHCKCGFEMRDFVNGNYGGYFYCQGEEEGREVYKEARALIDKHISPDIPVTLKRYCSEYELKYGATDQHMHGRDDERSIAEYQMWEELVESAIVLNEDARQPAMLRNHILKEWLERAYSAGDVTALEFNHTDESCHYYTQLKTYHKEI